MSGPFLTKKAGRSSSPKFILHTHPLKNNPSKMSGKVFPKIFWIRPLGRGHIPLLPLQHLVLQRATAEEALQKAFKISIRGSLMEPPQSGALHLQIHMLDTTRKGGFCTRHEKDEASHPINKTVLRVAGRRYGLKFERIAKSESRLPRGFFFPSSNGSFIHFL